MELSLEGELGSKMLVERAENRVRGFGRPNLEGKVKRLQFRRTELYIRVWLCWEHLDWFLLSARSIIMKKQERE